MKEKRELRITARRYQNLPRTTQRVLIDLNQDLRTRSFSMKTSGRLRDGVHLTDTKYGRAIFNYSQSVGLKVYGVIRPNRKCAVDNFRVPPQVLHETYLECSVCDEHRSIIIRKEWRKMLI